MGTGATRFADRHAMVDRQLRRRGIVGEPILDAFSKVPREVFIADDLRHLAYGDHPLPIESGQSISQPYIVALMIQEAAVRAGDRVLEVGAGSGYAAAVVSRIAAEVVAIERQPELVSAAKERVRRLGYSNVTILEGDGTIGCPERAPFDAIIVAASGSHVPKPLIDQLGTGGRLVIPVGEPDGVQKLIKVVKTPDGTTIEEDLGAVRFVPLIGQEGWDDAGN